MYTQAAIKSNALFRNGVYDIAIRGVHHYGIKKAVVMLYQIRHSNRYNTQGFKGI